jgi:hypothetical protein
VKRLAKSVHVGTAVALLVVLASGALAARAAADVTVKVSSRQIHVDEILTVVIQVEGPDAQSAKLVGSPPPGQRLDPVSRAPSVSQQLTVVNGRRSRTTELELTYAPTEAGEARVPSFVISTSAGRERTEAIPIEVLPGRSPEPLGVEARLDRSTIYVGETVQLDYVLRVRGVSPRGIEPDRLPPLPGFVIDDAPMRPGEIKKSATDDQGREWTEYLLFRRRLTPTRTGELEIPPVVFATSVLRKEREDPFGFGFGFGMDRYRRVEMLAPRKAITVRPLPEEGRPAEFSGAVGRFELAGDVPDVAGVGDAFNLELVVEGEGSLETASPPRVSSTANVEIYPPVEGRSEEGERRWSFPIVPRTSGTIRVGSARFSYFDPASRRYEIAEAGPFELEVEPGNAPVGSTDGGGDRPAAGVVTTTGTDLRFIVSTPSRLVDRRDGFAFSSLFYALVALPLVALPLVVVGAQVAARRAASPAGRRSRVRREIARSLDAAARADDGGDAALHVLHAFHAWASDTLGEPSRPLDRARLRRRLAEATGDARRADEAIALLDDAEATRYARPSGGADELVARARALSEAS